MFNRRFALGLLLAALLTLPVLAQEANSVIFVLRDSDRGSNDYQQGDVVEVVSGDVGVWLPPAQPFWLLRVDGITLAEAKAYMTPEYDANGNMTKRRLWQLKQNKVPPAVKTFFLTHRFAGFGLEPYISQFIGTIPDISSDTVLWWAAVRTWLINKSTGKPA